MSQGPRNTEPVLVNENVLAGPPIECSCLCHAGVLVLHLIVCCEQCARCGKRYVIGLAEHQKTCKVLKPGDSGRRLISGNAWTGD
jgi:hypothetical protein